MTPYTSLISLIVLWAFTAWVHAAPPPLGVTTDGICSRVVDGDTIDVEVRYHVRVRLLDCYAPESRTTDLAEKKRGLRSKEALTKLALGKPVILYVPTAAATSATDILTLNRILGHVWVEGSERSLSELQVAKGHATASKERR